jgi:sialic acid synthase SpsE
MFRIGKRLISKDAEPFIIAEISGNHNGKIENVFSMIDLASKNKIDAIKLQTYTADTITIKSKRPEFFIKDKKNLWKNNSLYSLYKKAHTPWSWHKRIFNYASKKNIICFSSPFDESAVDFLEKLNVPAYKVASFENDHYPLLDKIAKTGKPIIISTGLTNQKELNRIVSFFKKRKCKIALLKCTSTYPASLGATIIERHFTLKKNFGIDSKFSSTIEDLRIIKDESKVIWKSLGKIEYDGKKLDKASLKFKRSIYTCENIKKGEKFSSKNLKVIRPRFGVLPIYFNKLVNKRAPINLKKGVPIKDEILKKLKIN